MNIANLDTPVAVVDLDIIEDNIQRLQHYLDQHQIASRPHIKTHKLPEIAHMQLNAGAVGITCQKLGEAEVMAQAGITDIFISYNIIGSNKLERLIRLAQRVKITVAADSEFVIDGYAQAASTADTLLSVLVEFDTGANRCGAQSPEETATLVRQIHQASHLHFAGLMTYPSNEQTDDLVRQVRALLEPDGITIQHVSGGGTPKMFEAHTHPEVTEHRAGTYIYGDRSLIKNGAITQANCAMTILTTVMSRPTEDRGILDGGGKALSYDRLGPDDGHGHIVEYPEAHIYGLSEEHAHVDFSKCTQKPKIGEVVSVIPNHCCVVTNLFNEMVGVRGDQVEVIWPIASRGLLR
ncbi:MAG: D-TA family PLP-dependent enzyme [Chloroflexota bacterium]